MGALFEAASGHSTEVPVMRASSEPDHLHFGGLAAPRPEPTPGYPAFRSNDRARQDSDGCRGGEVWSPRFSHSPPATAGRAAHPRGAR